MRIAFVTGLKDSLGGRNQIVYKLVEGMAKRGHQVTFIGTGDSQLPAEIIPIVDKALMFQSPQENDFYFHTAYLSMMTKKMAEMANQFDIIANHVYPEFLPLLVANQIQTPIVTTTHAQVTPYLAKAMSGYKDSYFVFVSNSHRDLARKYAAFPNSKTIYNGIDVDKFTFSNSAEDHLLFFGRINYYKDETGKLVDAKGWKVSLDVAKESGESLEIAGPVLAGEFGSNAQQFYDTNVSPFIDGEKIKFVSKIQASEPVEFEQKVKLLGRAKALLFPINWDEPFGLVMVEALACGTPVIGFNRASVPEIIINGKTGFIVNNREEMIKIIPKIKDIKREDCRQRAFDFTTDKMVNNYIEYYEEIYAQTKK